MKICFYSPYVPKHFGGGEKHFFDVATLAATKHEVFIAINEKETKSFEKIKKDYQKFLNYSLDSLQFVKSPIPTGSFLEKLFWTKEFDYFYYATDGSLFFSLAKKNNLHLQIPFTDKKTSLIDRIKLKNWNIKNTNSAFTKKVIEENWKTKIDFVHNPKVSFEEVLGSKSGTKSSSAESRIKKEKIILHVGRFFRQLHSKRQDVLVEIFKELVSQHTKLMKGWKLVLIGTIEDKAYYNEVKELAKGLPIDILIDVSRETLMEYYKKSKIYWHATGYEIDENISPEKVEHFGITTIEAMAAGCIPIVLGKGGQVEVLGNELSELLWQTKGQCVDKTIKVINGTIDNSRIKKEVLKQVKKFDENVFAQKLWKMF
jgi:glycosyltransferase involved in cell wall biosynthesis